MQKVNSVIRSALLAGTAVVATFGGISSAQASKVPGALEDKLVAVCQAIKDDSRIGLHRAVRDSGISYRRLARGLVCDGMDMYTFAMQHGADNTGAVIAKRTNLEEQSLTAKQQGNGYSSLPGVWAVFFTALFSESDMAAIQSDNMVVRFIGKPSVDVDAFHQFLSQHSVAPFEFQFTADITEVPLNELVSSHLSVAPNTLCQPPDIRIVVTDHSTIKPFTNTGLRGVTSVMCGHSNQDAIQAFNAGVGMFFCLSASVEEKRRQMHRLYLKYQSRVQALKWQLVSEQLARQRACSPARLMAELTNLKSNCSRPSQQIALRCGADWQYVDWQTIRYVEAAGDYMCVYTQEETLIVRSTLTDMARRLPKHAFTRVNRSIIVNTQFVKRLIKLNSRVNYVELQDGSKVKISRRLMPVCHQQLDASLSQS